MGKVTEKINGSQFLLTLWRMFLVVIIGIFGWLISEVMAFKADFVTKADHRKVYEDVQKDMKDIKQGVDDINKFLRNYFSRK